MSTQSESTLKRGDYAPATESQLRGPCPFVNSLANHGYISRDGRNIHTAELLTAVREAGCSSVLTALFVHPIFLEYRNPKDPATTESRSFLGKVWYYLSNPYALLFSKFGMRDSYQVDSQGPYLNLDQLARHDVVEHDISLTRRDVGQGDNLTKQPDLVEQLLSSSSDAEQQYLSLADLAVVRTRRIADQRAANPGVEYGKQQHQVACGEIALILAIFGDGKRIRRDWVSAFFKEERFPIREGWVSRNSWWQSFGVVQFAIATEKVKKVIGLTF